MKTRPLLFLLAGAAALALGACATLSLKRGGVCLQEAYIAIHPGTNISPQDEAQLDHILRQYKSSLYKIKKTQNGQMTTRGRLKDVYIKPDLLAEVANSGGVSYWALQIGMAERSSHIDHADHPDKTCHVEHTNHIEHTSNIEHTQNVEHTQNIEHTQNVESQISPKDYAKCVELVRRVTPILRKYSRN
jgi:hypothetical protein